MSTLLEVFPGVRGTENTETTFEFETPASIQEQNFAEVQIRGLVQQLFLNGKKQRARQVVFSAVDQGTDVAGLCVQVGEALARQNTGTVCIVETLPPTHEESGHQELWPLLQDRFATLRDAACELSDRLWFLPADALAMEQGRFLSGCLRESLAQLRVKFDYTLLHVPGAACRSEAAILGGLCDGVVLVVRANHTRRAAAQRASQLLHAAHAKLLGVVLTDRRFPIPAEIYKRL